MDLRALFDRLRRATSPAPAPTSPPQTIPTRPRREIGRSRELELWFENSAGRVEIARIDNHDAFERWRTLRAEVESTGRWPLLIGTDNWLDLFNDPTEDWDGDVETLLTEAATLDPEAILARGYTDALPDDEEEREEYDFLDLDFDPQKLIVPPAPVATPSFVSYEAKGTSLVCTLPTRNGWEAPAHLGYGGWNGYPHVAEHVALLRRWHRLYGAELVTLTTDLIELRPARPIFDPVVAATLAREWFAYSYDNVAQGSGSLPALAQDLLGAELWSSWWD